MIIHNLIAILQLISEPRHTNVKIDTIIIHSMFNPTHYEPFSVEACLEALTTHNASCHYVIGRNGDTLRCVPEEKTAWHAGESKMPDGRTGVNKFSIGIELIGYLSFTREQYNALNILINDIKTRHEIKFILGHSDIAPGRKSDPGPYFEWCKIK